MDDSQVPRLIKVINQVVKHASRPGGPLERGEFTMGIARKEVAVKMGLGEDGLDEKRWKGLVKEHVTAALEKAGEEESEPEPSPVKKPKAKKPEPKEEAGPSRSSPAKPPSKPSSSKPPKEKKSRKDEPIEVDDSPEPDVGDKSESEMSSLYDVAPTKRKSKKSRRSDGDESDDSRAKKKEKRPKKDPNEGLSPEEAKVAELKRIVVACGVRKQWSKEFADCDKPSQQKRRLERMLEELGMKGTPTMGKARSLKEKRELAQELDDVREFEAARGVSSERASRSKVKTKKQEQASDSEGEEEEEEVARPKEKSALGAIMDFLGDDGDDSDD